MSHTPTPYKCSQIDWKNQPSENNWYITGDHHDGSCTAVAVVAGNATAGDITRDTAEFLCHAANTHEELVTTLETFPGILAPKWHLEAWMHQVRAALEKARR